VFDPCQCLKEDLYRLVIIGSRNGMLMVTLR